MEYAFIAIAIGLVSPFIAKLLYPHEITPQEMLGMGVLTITLGVLVIAIGRYSAAMDEEVLNGKVTSKEQDRVSCSHSYPCRCKKDGGCDTCYEHSNDWDWVLHSEVGDIKIDRIDRRGSKEPPRYTQAKIGDPVAKLNTYLNYVKAAPDSLFNYTIEKQALAKYANKLPSYPIGIYDYHYLNRVLDMTGSIPEINLWNLELANMLRLVGPQKQANVIVIFTNAAPDYKYAIRQAWLGGKKNDIIVLIGITADKIDWADIVSWTDAENFKVELKDAISGLKTIDRVAILEAIQLHALRSFKRKHMADFEYLKGEIDPPIWVIVISVLISLGAAIGAAKYISEN